MQESIEHKRILDIDDKIFLLNRLYCISIVMAIVFFGIFIFFASNYKYYFDFTVYGFRYELQDFIKFSVGFLGCFTMLQLSIYVDNKRKKYMEVKEFGKKANA